jgi:hypothetical protein
MINNKHGWFLLIAVAMNTELENIEPFL